MFMDGAKYHVEKANVGVVLVELGIVPVWNVAYHFDYNEAVEKFWAMAKNKFRKLLLQKMLKTPNKGETPLKDAVKEVMLTTDRAPIKEFIRRGLSFLRHDSDNIREARGLERLHWSR